MTQQTNDIKILEKLTDSKKQFFKTTKRRYN